MYFLPYLYIFAHFFSFCIAEFFPSLITYKQLAVVLVFISVYIIIKEIFYMKLIGKRFIITSVATFLICYSFYQTGSVYYYYPDYTKNIYYGEFLAVTGQTVPTILVAMIFARKDRILFKTERIAPYVSILFTFVSFFSALFPSSTTSGGYALDENGMNYQNISYMSAFASSLTFFYLLNFRHICWHRFFCSQMMFIFMSLLVLINLFTIILSGGRGGLVLFVFQFLLFIVGLRRSSTQLYLLKFLPILLLILWIVLSLVDVVKIVNIDSSGFVRILNFINEGEDSGRGDIRRIAYDYIVEKPLWGYGIGSSSFIIGLATRGQHIHGHNFFVDSLLEIGIIGTSVLFFVLLYTIYMLYKQTKLNPSNYFWLILFFDGFIYSMFSGYYLAHLLIAWTVGYAISKRGINVPRRFNTIAKQAKTIR